MVAIPARNEAGRIGPCLDALAAQPEASSLTVLLLLNGCTDATEAQARDHADRAAFRLILCREQLPPGRAHVGEARGRAMDAAAALLEQQGQRGGVVLSTDADSRVAPDWLSANISELQAGADAVAGQVEYDPEEIASLPPALRARIELEQSYADLLARMEAALDPLSGEAWPRHRMASGASIAVHLPAYRRAGGLPRIPVGEDRAMVAALRAVDARIRHSRAVRVLTSCRMEGRASGGAADTLRLWADQPSLPCDSLLEAASSAAFRWRMRAALRRLYLDGHGPRSTHWATRLLLPPHFMQELDGMPFGTLWQMAESASPLLRLRPISPAELPTEIISAHRILACVLTSISEGPGDTVPRASAVKASESAPSPA